MTAEKVVTEKTFAEILEAATEEARRMDAPLSVRLQAVADTVRELSPPFADVIDRLVARLADNGVGVTAPGPGEPMPPRDGTSCESVEPPGKGLARRVLQSRPLVPLLPPRRGCACAGRGGDRLARRADRRHFAGNLGVGRGTQGYAKAPFHILSDLDGGYALELNLLFWVGDEAQRALSGAGVDLVQFQGNDTWMLPIPATFLVGSDGVVVARFVDPDYRRRMEV